MMKDLQDTYSKNLEDRWNILCPKKGDICVALFSEDKQWSRAEIVGENINILTFSSLSSPLHLVLHNKDSYFKVYLSVKE